MKHVVVIGGGVVGLTTAWALVDAGFEVSLIERNDTVATGASHGNGGQLSYRYVSPLADAGIPLKALGWLLRVDSPVRFRPELSWRQWRWMTGFLAHCNARSNRRTTDRLLRLGLLSQSAFNDLCDVVPAQSIALRTPGKLVVYRQQEEFDKAARNTESGSDAMAAGEVRLLTAQQCVALEPALSDACSVLAGGIYTRNEAVADCREFCLQLLSKLQERPSFRVLTNTGVTGFVIRGGRMVAVNTGKHEVAADECVIATGLQSVELAASAGVKLPIYPLKGYSLSAPIEAGHIAPEVSVTDAEQKVLYARIGGQLRVAAMADLVGNDETIDQGRIAYLQRMVRATMPRAANYDRAIPWAGLRPATPSGAPILGKTPVAGLWLNVGHGPLGFTFASGSARILAALISQRESPIPLDGLTLA
ncbi:MAG: D-amino acid dehydrogenase [Betaproteobacteria bacterium]|nr:D-amino acid dehydrogenase [Betaproteobacteria bacterium]